MDSLRIGVIGCGQISRIYCENAKWLEGIEIVACADLEPTRAEALKERHGIPRSLGVEELLADPEIQIVLNLTVPAAHAEIAMAALWNGKSVYCEKPLAVKRRAAREMVGLARERGLRLGCAPDTILGAGLQTCRQVLDSGMIGDPVAATAFTMGAGHESWHPNPGFYYEKGGGPLFDMGPYYLSALTFLLGPVSMVSALGRITHPERIITSQPLAGQSIPVETHTHISASLEFASGPIASLVTSFDVQGHGLPRIEIYGTEGSLRIPDPNTFGGPVLVLKHRGENWQEIPLLSGYTENSRGIGLADMAAAMHMGRDHRCNERLAYHVLDIMHCVLDSSERGRHEEVASTMTRPEPLPDGLVRGRVDL